jgi:hypothetical protein
VPDPLMDSAKLRTDQVRLDDRYSLASHSL